jgi:hypothetical protein
MQNSKVMACTERTVPTFDYIGTVAVSLENWKARQKLRVSVIKESRYELT